VRPCFSLWARRRAGGTLSDADLLPPPAAPGSVWAPAAVLATSPFFDAGWYAEISGCDPDPVKAARHYLRHGSRSGAWPHPLFSPAFAVRHRPSLAEGADPLLNYLRHRAFDVPTHPLFKPAAYVRQYPAAALHPYGPLGHYIEMGAAEGLAPNGWYRATGSEPRGLVDWVVARRREWAASHRADSAAVDWPALADAEGSDDVVTVVVRSGRNWRRTAGCLASVVRAGAPQGRVLDCLLVDDSSEALSSQVLSSLAARHANVRIVHQRAGMGFCASVNRALQGTIGSKVVLLDAAVDVRDGWLDPLLARLDQPDVLAAQSLLISPTGTVHGAGVAFPRDRRLPYHFLHGFPVEDADALADAPFAGLSRSALALRLRDLVAVRGLDPGFREGLEDVDLCLRLAQMRGGRFVLEPRSRVTYTRTVTTAELAGRPALDRLLARWKGQVPRDEEQLWRSAGFSLPDVLGEATPGHAVNRAPVHVTEDAPRLRWALKVAAPAGAHGELWGDMHFARRLAVALRDLGQQVVIDHPTAFARHSARLDDVNLSLRGLASFRPVPGAVNLLWVISHPELLTRQEVLSYDRVLAASESWSRNMSRRWHIAIRPLLQATDPGLFHPERARPDSGERLLFVGGSRRQYRRMVRHSVEGNLPLAVYGSGWEDFIPPHHIKAQSVPNSDVGRMYASAGVVLNDHWDDMRAEGFLSNRLFDAVASGARVVTDDVAGLARLFGQSVQVARNVRTLRDLVHGDLDGTFGTYDQRRRAAERVHREHSFLVRAQALLEVALDVRRHREAEHRRSGGRPVSRIPVLTTRDEKSPPARAG
jgi:glycosyl transferase family 2/glycosyl transferase family 1